MPKKTLATILKERTDTIEYRAIRKHLMNTAQNGKNEYRIGDITQQGEIIELRKKSARVKYVMSDTNEQATALVWYEDLEPIVLPVNELKEVKDAG